MCSYVLQECCEVFKEPLLYSSRARTVQYDGDAEETRGADTSAGMLERGRRSYSDWRHSDTFRATPPWLDDMSSTTRGRGRSTTFKPTLRSLRQTAHVVPRLAETDHVQSTITNNLNHVISFVEQRTHVQPSERNLEQLVGEIETETGGDVTDARRSCTLHGSRVGERAASQATGAVNGTVPIGPETQVCSPVTAAARDAGRLP